MAKAILKGTRLAYVVVEIEGSVKRAVHSITKKDGIKEKMQEQPAGFLVYFPRGHVMRVKDRAGLRAYGLDKEPDLLEMHGLQDPKNPIGKLFLSQEQGARARAWDELEQQVIQLATAKAGPVEVFINPNQAKPKHARIASAGLEDEAAA